MATDQKDKAPGAGSGQDAAQGARIFAEKIEQQLIDVQHQFEALQKRFFNDPDPIVKIVE